MQSLNTNDVQAVAGGRSTFFFRYLLLFILLIFCIFQFHIYKICGFSIYPDEFGYWASAAGVLGYDWSATAALGSYYSFGYAIILTPILWICKDSVTAYRTALTVNMLLQCGAVGILWEIYKRLHFAEDSKERKMQAVLAVGIAAFYPPWSFYVQMTLAEALLMFLYIFICYQMFLFVEKPNMISALLLSLSLIYIYFVHMRTIAVVIAVVITLILYAWKTSSARKYLAAIFAVLVIGTVCGMWMKTRVTDTVYAVSDVRLLSVNDYRGRLETLKSLFTSQGIKAFLISSAGKMYYLIMASFGLFVPAVFICFHKTYRMFQNLLINYGKQEKSENNGNIEYFYFFCLLSMLGEFIITTTATMSPDRLDGFIYGRYNEHLLPVFVGIGLLAFCEMKHKLRVFIESTVLSAILFAVTFRYAVYSGLTIMQGYFAPGVSYLSDDWNYKVTWEFPKAFFFGTFLMIFVMMCVYVGKRFGKYIYALGVILFMEILLALGLGEKYTKPFNDVDYYNLRIAQYMTEYEAPVSYLYSGGFQYIDLIQFAMKDRKVDIIRLQDMESAHKKITQVNEISVTESAELESILPKDGFLIVDQGCKYMEEIEQKYKKCSESQAFVLFIVK